MNHKALTIILIALSLVVAVFTGVMLFLRFTQAPATQQQQIPPVTFPSDSNPPVLSNLNSKSAVQSAFQKEIAPYDTDHTQLYETVISGEYALQVWKGLTFGGEALLKFNKTQNKWAVITGGGGTWSLHGLIDAGVPAADAAVLIAAVPH